MLFGQWKEIYFLKILLPGVLNLNYTEYFSSKDVAQWYSMCLLAHSLGLILIELQTNYQTN